MDEEAIENPVDEPEGVPSTAVIPNDRLLALTCALVGDPRLDDLCAVYLEIAKSAVVARLFPFVNDATWADVPERHQTKACQIACYLVNKRGAEGETSHSENGVSRTYASADIPDVYFDGIVPFCGVPR